MICRHEIVRLASFGQSYTPLSSRSLVVQMVRVPDWMSEHSGFDPYSVGFLQFSFVSNSFVLAYHKVVFVKAQGEERVLTYLIALRY